MIKTKTNKQRLVQLTSAKRGVDKVSTQLYDINEESLGERAWKLMVAIDKAIAKCEKAIESAK